MAAPVTREPLRLGALLTLPTVLLIGALLVLPYLGMAVYSVLDPDGGGFTAAVYRDTLSDPFHWQVVGRTLRLALITTAVTAVLGFPLAYGLARARGRWRTALLAVVVAPLLVGVIVRSYGWLVLLDDNGLVNQAIAALGLRPWPFIGTDLGVLVAYVHIYLPFMVLPLSAALENLDADVEFAARSLGAGGWSTFRHVVLPAALPGLRSGAVLVFMLSVSAYVIPSLLGAFQVITAPVLIVQLLTVRGDWATGTALALVLFAAVAVVVAVLLAVLRRPALHRGR